MSEDTNITKELTEEVEQLDNVLLMENDLYDSESYSEDEDEEHLIVDISYYDDESSSSPSPSSHSLSLSIGTGNDDSQDLVPEEKSPSFGLPFRNEGKSKKALAEEALLLNRKLQVNFIDHIHKIKEALKDSATKLAQVDESETTDATKSKVLQGLSLRAPYFRKGFSVPEPNDDAKAKKLSKDYDIIVSESAKDPRFYFRKSSRDILKKAVIENCKQTLLAPLLAKMENELEKKNKCVDDLAEFTCEIGNLKSHKYFMQPAENPEDVAERTKLMKDIEDIEKKMEKKNEELEVLKRNIAKLEQEINTKKLVTDEEILSIVQSETIDWMKISRMNFKGNTTWVDCQKAWENQVSPRLNNHSWSQKEESALKKLVANAPSGEWQKIALDLGTGRTAWQCFTYYQRHLNQELESRPWTKAEEANLVRITHIIKDQFGHYRWTQVASLMDCRSPKECMMKYTKINPKQSHGRWSKSEDAKLKAAYEIFGPSWSKIASSVESRNAVQCRDRYCHCLAPNIKYRRFSYDDDAKLLRLHKEMGPAWSKMVKHFDGRTDSMLLGRYRTLQKWKEKTHWFENQSTEIKNLLLGKSLKADERNSLMAQLKEYMKSSLGVDSSDYKRQKTEREQNLDPDLIPPRPPLHLKFFHRPQETHIDIKHWCQKLSRNKKHIERLQNSLKQRTLSSSPTELHSEDDGEEKAEKSSRGAQDDGNTKHMEMVLNKLFLKQGQMNVQEIVKLAQEYEPKKKSELRLHHNINKELKNLLGYKKRSRTTKLGRARRYFERETRPNHIVQAEAEQVKYTVPSILMKSLGTDVKRLYNQARWKRLQCLLKMRDLNSQPIESDPDYRREVGRLNRELERLTTCQEKDTPDTVRRRNMLKKKITVIKGLFSRKLVETVKDLESCLDTITNDMEYLNAVLRKRNTTEAEGYPDVQIANFSQDDQCPAEPFQEKSTTPLVDSSFSGKRNVVNALKKLKCSLLSPTKGNRPERRLSDEGELNRHEAWTEEKLEEESKSLLECVPLHLEDLQLLAPNSTTVRCLKRLLLKEGELNKRAGKLCRLEGDADHSSEEAGHAVECGETSSESESMEEDDCQILLHPRPYFIQPVVPDREGERQSAEVGHLRSTESQTETTKKIHLSNAEVRSEAVKTSHLPNTDIPAPLTHGVKNNKVIYKISKDGSHIEIIDLTHTDEVAAQPVQTEQSSFDQVKKNSPETLEAESILSNLRQNDDYKNLLIRFRALFMWPLLLSTTQSSDNPMPAKSTAKLNGISQADDSTNQQSGHLDLPSKLNLYVKNKVEEKRRLAQLKWISAQSQQIPSNSNDSTQISYRRRKRKRGRPVGYTKEAAEKKKLEESQTKEAASVAPVETQEAGITPEEIQEVLRDIKIEVVEQTDDNLRPEVISKRKRGRPAGSKKKPVERVCRERPRRSVCYKQTPEVDEDTREVARQLPQWWRDAILAAMMSRKALRESQEEDQAVDIADDEDFCCKGNYSDDEWAVQSKTWK